MTAGAPLHSARHPRDLIAPPGPLTRASISWRVNAERIVLLGWGRAILLQLAHPLIAAGVHEHSSFRGTRLAALTRLYHTIHAMLAVTFGDEAEREQALDGIRAIHRRVNGRLAADVGLFPAGTSYSAEDPDLVLWVHATLLESVPLAYTLFVGPMTDAQRDAYCAEAAWVALALHARERDVPRTWAATREYIDRMHASGTLVVGAQARELAHAVLEPPLVTAISSGAWLNRLITLSLLPQTIRDQYLFQWNAASERRAARARRALRAIRKVLPAAVAHWPVARTGSRRL